MSSWCYRYSGLKVVSVIELPEWTAFLQSDACADPDIFISIVPTKEPVADELKFTISQNEYSFFVSGIGHYRITDGTQIVVTHFANVEPQKLRLFLLGSAWGALCYQRGILAVHAGSVQIGSGAVLLCAPQGGGKSTTTAWLAARGHALISDDLCCLDFPEQGKPVVHPSAQRLRLWGTALDALGWKKDELQRDFFRIDKYQITWKHKQLLQPVPLQAVILLGWGEISLERLTGGNALRQFIHAATYRGELLDLMGTSGTYWQQCLELLEKVPVWALKRQKDFVAMDQMAELLEAQFGESKPQ